MKKQTMGQKIIIAIALLINIVVLANNLLNWQLFSENNLMVSMIGIFISSLLLWLFVSIDWPSLLCILSMALIPGVGFKTILPMSLGNVTFAFLMFTFIVTYALDQTNFIKRVTAWALHSKWAQNSPWKLLVAFYTVMLLLGSFISPTILFMIAYPIFEELCHQFHFEKGNRNAGIMVFTLYTTIAIGTAMTPINHVFAITAIGLYEAAFAKTISYVSYMQIAIPIGLLLFIILLLTVKYIWKLSLEQVTLTHLKSLENLPSATKKEKWIVGVFALVVVMWLLPEMVASFAPNVAAFFKTAGIAFPPLLGAIILSIVTVEDSRLVDISKAMKEGVYWPSLLLVGATLALGGMIAREDVGIVAALNDVMTPIFANLPAFVMVLVFVIWAGIQTNLSSNLVTVTVLSAIAIALAQSTTFGANSAVIAVFIGFMASLAMMTPPAMPYVAISVGANWLTSRQALVYGFWMLVVAIIAVMLVGYPIGMSIL